MTCAEARKAMSGLLAGRLGLTEWAELEGHTAACETCDRTLNFRYHGRFEEHIDRHHSVASRTGRLAKRAGIGVTAVLILGAIGVYAYPRLSEIPRLPEMSVSAWRGLQLPAVAGELLDSLTASGRRLASATAQLPAVAGELLDSLTASARRLATAPSPAPPVEESRRDAAPKAMPSPPSPSPAPPVEESRSAAAPEAVPSPPPSPAPRAEESKSVVVSEAMPLPPPPSARPAEPSPIASASPAAPASTLASPSPSATTAPPLPSPPAVAPEPPVPPPPAAATRPAVSPSAPRTLPPRSAAPPGPIRSPEPKTAAQKPAKEPSVAQSPRVQDERPQAAATRPLAASHSDVIAQLFVQDRQEARRDIGLLLARLGGSRKAERESTVWLEVPRSRYAEFTRGLAQIGSWQSEQGSSALPDPVAVTVILTR